jgi:O-antigen ligase
MVDWLQRAVSLLLLVGSVEQIAHHLAHRRAVPSMPLLLAFAGYWVGSVALPAALGAHPQLSHDLLYAPAVGMACCLVTATERERLLALSRDALLLLMLAGLALAPVRPAMVMDLSYSAGWLHGLPRFAGLTSHPVTQGLLAQVALLLLMVRPYSNSTLHRAAWALGLGVLVLAQSKTAWLAFLASVLVMTLVRHGAQGWRRLADPRHSDTAMVIVGCVAISVILIAAAALSPTLTDPIDRFLASDQGEQLMTLTGRDRIWVAAQEEWQRHPFFGYGLSLWDASYRAAIGLPHATHAHNQLLDDAARAGSVGAGTLLVYASVLLVMCLRCARATQGLSLALGLTLALRAIGEVPLSLLGYGPELFTHLLLVTTLAAAAPTVSARPTPVLP